MRDFSARERKVFVASAICILVYVLYLFFSQVLNSQREGLETKIEGQERILKKNQRVIQRAAAFDAEYASYLNLMQQKLTEEGEMTAILSEIQAIAKEIDLRINELKPQKVKKVDFYNRFSVDLSISSDPQKILHFLYLLESKSRRFYIDAFQLENRLMTREASVNCRLSLSRILIP